MRPNTTAILTSLVSFCAGVLLMILPWSAFWEHNLFFQSWPALEAILVTDVARVAVTSLGVIDFALGLIEMQPGSHQKEPEPTTEG